MRETAAGVAHINNAHTHRTHADTLIVTPQLSNMDKIIEFDESIYMRLCDDNLSDIEKWEETVLIAPACGTIENNPKLRVVLELIYHALQFSVSNNLKFSTTVVLMEAIQSELFCLMQNDGSVINETGCKERYVEVV